MQWDVIASVATAVSATAVVASVVYGANQLRLNTKALNANSHHQWIAEQREVNRAFIENPEICELVIKGNANFADLSDAERMRLAFVFWTGFNLWNFVRHAYKQGVVDKQTHDENSLGLEWFIQSNEVARKLWPICRVGYGQEFRGYIDNIIKDAEAKVQEETECVA